MEERCGGRILAHRGALSGLPMVSSNLYLHVLCRLSSKYSWGITYRKNARSNEMRHKVVRYDMATALPSSWIPENSRVLASNGKRESQQHPIAAERSPRAF